jgi:glutathione S-transferase
MELMGSKRVLMALEEKNIPFELQTIDWAAAEHKSPAYLAKQPFGVIPYLDDDGFIIFGNPPSFV